MIHNFIFDTAKGWNGRTARKVQQMYAKHMSAIIADSSTLSKFLLQTLEGEGPVRENALYCRGVAGDVWLQDPVKAIAKYNLKDIQFDGWMVFVPKPDVQVEFFELTSEVALELEELEVFSEGSGACSYSKFFIQGQWGKTVNGFENCQECKIGDMIVRNITNHKDQWVVARSIWNNSYQAD